MRSRSRAQDQRLRFWNQVVYSALAPIYNGLDWLTFGVWWRLVRRALEAIPPNQQVLEIGFGPGKLHVELARQAALCAGLDLAWGMCRYTQRRLIHADLPVRITRGSVYELPYPNVAFDCVVSTFAFSGFPEGPRALAEMARVTRSGGRVVLVDIGLPEDGNRLGTGLARLWEQMGDFLYDLPAMMAEAGLRVITFKEYGPGRHIRLVVAEKTGSQNFL
ncbi:MAG: methyltransferase domain-containing protein [Anaerolineae bacterium]|nr:methyltransferase domain-containing protein [Anaerolineae bacterium]